MAAKLNLDGGTCVCVCVCVCILFSILKLDALRVKGLYNLN